MTMPYLTTDQRRAIELSEIALRLLALVGMYPENVVDEVGKYLEAEAGEGGKRLAELLRDVAADRVDVGV